MIGRIGDPEVKEALSAAGRVGDFCLLAVRLYKSDAYPLSSGGWRSGLRCPR
jgi:hypothetical protein